MAAKDENTTFDDDEDSSFFTLDEQSLDEINQPGSRASEALNDFQSFQMEYIFNKDPNLHDHDAKSLGSSIGLTTNQVQNWFQNQRDNQQRENMSTNVNKEKKRFTNSQSTQRKI